MQRHRYQLEQVIESVDTVIWNLECTPWVFRFDSNGILVADEKFSFKNADERTEEETLEQANYVSGMWGKNGTLFFQSPFTLSRCVKMQELDWLDVACMTWSEINDTFLAEELPLLRTVLRSSGYWHEPVPAQISEEGLTQLIAFRYKERLVYEMCTKEEIENDEGK